MLAELENNIRAELVDKNAEISNLKKNLKDVEDIKNARIEELERKVTEVADDAGVTTINDLKKRNV